MKIIQNYLRILEYFPLWMAFTILISGLVLKHGLICCIYVRSCVYTYVWFINYLNQMQSTASENEIVKLAEISASEKASVGFREPVTVWIQCVSDAGLHAVNRSTRTAHTADHLTHSHLESSFYIFLCVCVCKLWENWLCYLFCFIDRTLLQTCIVEF